MPHESIADVVKEHMEAERKRLLADAEQTLREWEAIPAEERQQMLDQFTRPDGSLCEHWWQPSIEGWG